MSAVEALRPEFFEIATKDEPLALATEALVDLIKDGDFRSALKLNKAIATRLELLAVNQEP